MQKWFKSILKTFFGIYFALTSLYCLLAFLPYTYYALIKAPPYSWVIWFVHHHAFLFWLAWAAAAAAYRPREKRVAYFVYFGALACVGIFLSFRPLLVGLEDNRSAYWGSLMALWAIIAVVLLCDMGGTFTGEDEFPLHSHLSYGTGILLGAGIALLSLAGAELRSYSEKGPVSPHVSDIYLTIWSVGSHILVAIILISILNLVRIGASRTNHTRLVRWSLVGFLIFASLWALSVHFLENALSFEGWHAHLYAASLAAALALLGFSIARPFLLRNASPSRAVSRGRATVLIGASLLSAAIALALPTLLRGGDWNGLYQGTFTLIFWVIMGFCVFRLRPSLRTYPVNTVLAILFLSLFSCKALVATEIFWAKPLGATDDEIQLSLENYAGQDASFELAFHLLGNGRTEPCGDLCRIMRQYTEIRGAQARFDLKLVNQLVLSQGERPNIFLFVVDSMRPDYLGAYNPKATFTPNMDALARDSVVVRNVFTNYAGTSLSEPAIWAGALLLHAHFMQPFERVNSLEKLVKADGYQMVVSEDEILGQILSPSDDLIKLDTDKKLWNQLDICSTIQQAESTFEHRAGQGRPIFFYSQPKNVHQFARNSLPHARDAHWPIQPGFNYRISFELHQVDNCLGGFIGWLKTHALYDNSILIVTSDHGDATGEFGRYSHSVVIYPEVMRVPLIVHLPKTMQNKYVHDDHRVSALIDITPSLYYLLGHRPILLNPLFGHPLFAETQDELRRYPRKDLFMASDVRAAYGVLADNGRYFYATYDSPAKSYLYDLVQDPNGERNILTDALKKRYDEQVIEYLQEIANFYEYKPGIVPLLTTAR
ncbi:MAG: sulfatase-like hydrolase/transferase [Candidatus Acidiferrum sp.]